VSCIGEAAVANAVCGLNSVSASGYSTGANNAGCTACAGSSVTVGNQSLADAHVTCVAVCGENTYSTSGYDSDGLGADCAPCSGMGPGKVATDANAASHQTCVDPPPPPLPPYAAGTTFVVSSSATLGGLDAASFGAAQQALFAGAMAASLSLDASAVLVTGVADAQSAAGRRHSLQSGGGGAPAVTVAFDVATTSDPVALMASVTSLSSDATALLSALSSAGLAVTGIVVAAPTLATVQAAPPPLPQPPAFPPAPLNFTNATAEVSYINNTISELGNLDAGQAQAVLSDLAASLTAPGSSLDAAQVANVFGDIASALASPDSKLDAAQTAAVVGNIAAALNAPDSKLNANASAAAELRASLLDAISNSAASVTSSAGLEAVADAVSSLVSNASQINAAGAGAALGMFASVSAAGSGGLTISNATGYAVANGLSSIVSAAMSPDSALSPGVLTQVFDVVNSLAGSQLSSLSLGAAPVEISSPAIQVRACASTGLPSRLD
jgi:hypothetical protein